MKTIDTAWLEITETCNLHCPYCYMDANSSFCGYSDEEYGKILEFLKKLDVKYVVLSGGEPFLHPQIIQYIEEAHKMGFRVGAATNGTILTDAILGCLSENAVFLQVSIDSMQSKEYIQSRGANHLDRVVSNLQKLVEHNIPVTLACTLTDLNADYALEICEFAKRIKIQSIHFGPVIPSKRCLSMGLAFSKFYDVAIKLYEFQINNYLDIQIDLVEEFVNLIANPAEEKENLFFCNAMAGKNIQIDTAGNIRQCGLIDSTGIINLFDCISKQRLTVSEIIGQCQSIVRPTSVMDIPSCSQCEFRLLCRGGCRACAYSISNDLLGVLPYCEEIKRFIRRIEIDFASGKLERYMSFLKLMRLVESKQYETDVKRVGIF